MNGIKNTILPINVDNIIDFVMGKNMPTIKELPIKKIVNAKKV